MLLSLLPLSTNNSLPRRTHSLHCYSLTTAQYFYRVCCDHTRTRSINAILVLSVMAEQCQDVLHAEFRDALSALECGRGKGAFCFL